MVKARMYYLKLLDENMESCNGGKQVWKLNEWVKVKGEIVMCENGIHLTLNPSCWRGARIFVAETSKVFDEDEDKAVCREARILYEFSKDDLKAYEEVEAPALKAYEEAKAPAWKAYEEVEAPAWKAYEEVEAQALKAYEEAKAQALKAYEEVEAQAWKAYEEALQSFLKLVARI